MSYHVSYNPELSHRYPVVPQRRKKISKYLVVFGLIAALTAGAAWRGGILRLLIPGDPETTVAAFSTMVERVGMGEPLRESILGFCQEIIVNGS